MRLFWLKKKKIGVGIIKTQMFTLSLPVKQFYTVACHLFREILPMEQGAHVTYIKYIKD